MTMSILFPQKCSTFSHKDERRETLNSNESKYKLKFWLTKRVNDLNITLCWRERHLKTRFYYYLHLNKWELTSFSRFASLDNLKPTGLELGKHIICKHSLSTNTTPKFLASNECSFPPRWEKLKLLHKQKSRSSCLLALIQDCCEEYLVF